MGIFFLFSFQQPLMKVIFIFNASIFPKPKTNFILIAFEKLKKNYFLRNKMFALVFGLFVYLFRP